MNRFIDLIKSVQHCRLCSRLCDRRKVLSEANGNLESKVLFIAEAPGRLGADRTGVPLCGDRTGDNFEMLLGNVGWRREQVFITNAVLCNPQEGKGINDTPTSEEIANCSAYLEMVIALIKPVVIATLGATALKAIELISPHGIRLSVGVSKIFPWCDYMLFPLYHPAPRATVHRSLGKQRGDFMRLAKIVHPEKGLITRVKQQSVPTKFIPEIPSPIFQLTRAILELGERMTYFKLTKLLYLIDFYALRELGHTISSEIYLRQFDGPWPPAIKEVMKDMDGHEVRRYISHQVPMVALGPSPRFKVQLDDEILKFVAEIWEKYGELSNSEIKTVVYFTAPMRFIMEEERKGKDVRKIPVLYKDKTAVELSS